MATAACQTCEWGNRRDRGDAPLWDSILRTPSWDVVHCQGTSLAGWIVLVSRRHITSLAELTVDEAAELGPLTAAVSRALPAIVDCQKTYLAQFAEHPLHPHVHVHVIPRAPDMPAEQRGPRVFFECLGVDPALEVPEERKNAIGRALRGALLIDGFGSPEDVVDADDRRD